jgi:septal ring factor EnvC (AmiA/AmiB activator)
MKALAAMCIAGMILMTAGGFWQIAGWVLFVLSLVAIYFQRNVIQVLRKDVAEERKERVKLEQDVQGLLKRVEEQKTMISDYGLTNLRLEREVKAMEKQVSEMSKEIAQLTHINATNMRTLERLSERYDELFGEAKDR